MITYEAKTSEYGTRPFRLIRTSIQSVVLRFTIVAKHPDIKPPRSSPSKLLRLADVYGRLRAGYLYFTAACALLLTMY